MQRAPVAPDPRGTGPRHALEAGQVHLWRVDLDLPPELLSKLARTLDPQETSRADRFHFPVHRRRFVVRRAALRSVLSHYYGRAPERIRYAVSTHGKLSLCHQPDDTMLEFNSSHSSEIGLIAVSRAQAIGVDIERVDPMRADPDLAKRFFAKGEVQDLTRIPDEERTGAFFNCWTRKEAYVKATGKGLTVPLDAFEVSLTPGSPARLLSVDAAAGEQDRWTMAAPEIADGYRAALVVAKPLLALRRFEWRPSAQGITAVGRKRAGCQ